MYSILMIISNNVDLPKITTHTIGTEEAIFSFGKCVYGICISFVVSKR